MTWTRTETLTRSDVYPPTWVTLSSPVGTPLAAMLVHSTVILLHLQVTDL